MHVKQALLPSLHNGGPAMRTAAPRYSLTQGFRRLITLPALNTQLRPLTGLQCQLLVRLFPYTRRPSSATMHMQKALQAGQIDQRHNGGPAMRTAVPRHSLTQGYHQLLTLLKGQHITNPAQASCCQAVKPDKKPGRLGITQIALTSSSSLL